MDERSYSEAKIILIEPEPQVLGSLREVLESAGYPPPREVASLSQTPEHILAADPDLVVFDLSAPDVDGYALLEELTQQLARDTFFPVLAVGSVTEPQAKERALRAGARDFLLKPIDTAEFSLHVHLLLDTRFTYERLRETRHLLEDVVKRRTSELEQAQLETLDILGRVVEVRDDTTGEHTKRVGRLAALLAQDLRLPPAAVEKIRRAAPLHDLGKVAVADSILLKQGPFEPDEKDRMQAHASLGAELLSGAQSELLQMARQIALFHHERWDGQGYPQGLAGQTIPLEARIVAVADSFNTLTHTRPYKVAWSGSDALAEIERERGGQFDPEVVDALLRIESKRRHKTLGG